MTKTRRTSYDHYMLQLHDRMKEDPDFQARGEQLTHAFPAGSTWVVYTDPGKESSWVTDLGSVRVLIHGAGNPDEYTRLAEAVTAASPIPR